MKLTTHFASARKWRTAVSLVFTVCAWVVAAITVSTASAAGLNDTGFTTCADAAGATVSCTAASAVQGQDARYGRDAAAGTSPLTKVGGGANGFDFTKISNAGAVLPATAPLGTATGEWGCTYDNTTGLMWEVKTPSASLRYFAHTYSWYSTNSATNGGGVGGSGGMSGGCFTSGRCDTEKFVQDVNGTNMCGHNDWRLPSFRELHGLVRVNTTPSIDNVYFPNTQSLGGYWSAASYAGNSGRAWTVHFPIPYSNDSDQKTFPYKFVRLVRTGL